MAYCRLMLLLNALVFGFFGAWFLVAPVEAASWVKIPLDEPMGITEIRVFYGGFEIGIALFLLIASLQRAMVGAGLLLVTLIYLCASAARMFGILEDASGESNTFLLLAVEVLLGITAAVGLWIEARTKS